MKKMQLQQTEQGTYNLSIERDSGNPVTILMSRKPKICLEEWRTLQQLCEDAISELQAEHNL